MPDYRRNQVPGGTFFFTANLLDRQSDLLVTQIDVLREAVRRVRARAPFHIDAWVVLPDHMHCLWTPVFNRGRLLPEGDTDFPGRWRAIKKGFSKSVRVDEPRSPVMIHRGERGIRQRVYTGSTQSATIAIWRRIWATFISIRSSTVWSSTRRSGRIPPLRRCVAGGLYPAGWMRSAGEPPETGERR